VLVAPLVVRQPGRPRVLGQPRRSGHPGDPGGPAHPVVGVRGSRWAAGT